MSHAAFEEAGPVVHTPSGSVRGIWDAVPERGSSEAQRIAVFRGIPYAEPPVGDLRFAPPRKRQPWSGIRDAVEFGATPQRGDRGITLIPEHSVPGDDTLNVNVWTPDPGAGAQLPVVVWIHGGGYISGSPVSPWYDGSAFARDGVVLVTLSYRLGFTGFGWIDGAAQNRGVRDWICALEWVRDHIASFGGDPDRVTIAGQSAGGSAVLTLLGAPAAAGLFHAAYAMSAAIADPSADAARARSLRLAKLAGVTPDLEGLSALTEARILELEPEITKPAAPRLLRGIHELLREGLMIGPIIDDETVLSGVETALSQGVSASVPLVLGTADGELAGMFKPGGLLDRAPRRLLLRLLGTRGAQAKRWLADPALSGVIGTNAMLGRYVTDRIFRGWVPRAARARAAAPTAGPTWSYRFSWQADEIGHAGHCIDVPFVFDCLDEPGVDRVAGSAPPQELADAVHGALVSLAKSGQPGWAPDDGKSGPTRIFDVPVRDERDAYASAAALLTE